jgi:hypothetical protein
MSPGETACLVRYQGARARWAARSWAGCPWRAYQTTARLLAAKANGTTRWTERGRLMRASAILKVCLPSRNACSMVFSQLAKGRVGAVG